MPATALDLAGLLPDFSDRDISETLTPIADGSNMRRTVNGRLISVSSPAFQKYQLSISGTDLYAPALSGVWPGQIVDIVPFGELTHFAQKPLSGWPLVNGDEIAIDLARFPLIGSIEITTVSGTQVDLETVSGKQVFIKVQDTSFYVRYRPHLQMMIRSWNVDEAEKDGSVSWSMEAEEV